jgi:hypothetical protein
MAISDYFGKIDNTYGFTSETIFEIPYFEKNVKIKLGYEYDEDYEEIKTPPSKKQLSEFEETLKDFLSNIEKIIIDIQESAFNYYEKSYSHYYEKPFEVLFPNSKVQKINNEVHPPLDINTPEKHFEFIKEILECIQVLENKTIIIPIHYALDEEHGIEIKIKANKVLMVEGIGQTSERY